jgi:hypothetical protein
MVPVFLGVLLSHCVFSKYSMSIFDVVLEFKNLPYLAHLGSIEAYYLTAANIMSKNFMYLSKESTLADLPVIISKVKSSNIAIPIVESEHKK